MGGEFALIARHFTWPTRATDLGVGDDAALVSVAPGMQLAVSTDLLVGGTHFLPQTDPRRLGHKSLAVNLSDMAAMGATPRWATLALALPSADDRWVAEFSRGMHDLADAFATDLIGGDTTRGPLAICVTIFGEVPAGEALRRDGARLGDDVWVSGTLGDAAAGLACLASRAAADAAGRSLRAQLGEAAFDRCRERLEAPQPRVALGLALRGIAHSAIDVSDGFAADLGHVLDRSGVGARVEVARLPVSPALAGHIDHPVVRDAIVAGGDDYELCFTAPESFRARVEAAGQASGVPVTRVGTVVGGRGLSLVDAGGRAVVPARAGFDHFG
jgi:thiamine-monophosphate kinase